MSRTQQSSGTLNELKAAGRRLRANASFVVSLAVTSLACSAVDESPSGGGAGQSAHTSGAENGGSSGASSPQSSGAAGASALPISGSGGSADGGTATGGTATGGTATGGTAAGGSSVGAGGTAIGGSSVGAGGALPANERCEIANYDAAKPPQVLTLTGSLGTHDPMIISDAGKFYLFSTGNNLGAKTSTNLSQWQSAPDVFSGSSPRPAWIAGAVPGVSNLWAPDVSFFGGQFHLYYSASTFASNRSCIGHATRASLSTGSWMDQGKAICSNDTATKDNWNAIDPNVVIDQAGTPWLALGSFWGGIKLIKLDQTGARVGTSLDSLAARPNNDGALEAAFIVRRCGFYYLFVSWDACCKGANSTYNTRFGRSESVQGPYVDKAGVAMLQGGGSLLVQGGERYKGPGHNAVIFTDKAAYNVYHAYDANNNGQSVLRISDLVWDKDGWPISAGP